MLWSSFSRSTASSSVDGPGSRKKNVLVALREAVVLVRQARGDGLDLQLAPVPPERLREQHDDVHRAEPTVRQEAGASRYARFVEHARAVIIGGGVGGTSIAYHLTELGWRDVVLVDRAELTSGSTFHSAGLVGQLRSTTTLTRMMMYGAELYRRLTAETGVDVSWHEVGSLRLASTKERFEELQRQAGWAKTFGLPLELITPEEAQAKFPLMTLDGVLGAVWLPTDGWLDPSGLAQALAAGARSRGATIRQHTRVVGDQRGARPRHGRRGRDAGTASARRSRRRSSSTPAACSRRRSGAWPA